MLGEMEQGFFDRPQLYHLNPPQVNDVFNSYMEPVAGM